MMQRINKAELVKRLEAILGEPVGREGLSTLLYGWTRKSKNLRAAISHRQWLYDYEVQALSRYAGYNLLIMES